MLRSYGYMTIYLGIDWFLNLPEVKKKMHAQ